MRKDIKKQSENTQQTESIRWVTAPISLDKLRITPGHESAANELVQVIQRALKANEKVIFAAGGESGTGKSEVAYLVGESLNELGIPTIEWSFDNAYVTSPAEREQKRAEDYDHNVGLNEMNRARIEEVMSCFEQDKPVTVPVIIINEDGSRPVRQITLEMEGKKVLIFDGLYAALIGQISTSENMIARVIAMSEKRFNLAAQRERGKEEVNQHRMKVLERECRAVRSLWPYVTHKISEDWKVSKYTHE
jgi:uridine kinase